MFVKIIAKIKVWYFLRQSILLPLLQQQLPVSVHSAVV